MTPLLSFRDVSFGYGVPDLISAYAASSGGLFTLHRGNIDAVYPNSLKGSLLREKALAH